MVVFSYGIPKSGSTLAFQLARAIATLGGSPQWRVPEPFADAGHKVNFQNILEPWRLRETAEAAKGRLLIVKTHDRPGPEWIAEYRRLVEAGLASAHVVHRDPRDICLAMLDAGAKARAAGAEPFSIYARLEPTAERVRLYLEELAVWTTLPATLELHYEVCAFAMDEAIDAIKAHLGVRCANWPVRFYAGRLAFTHRNKAVPQRHRRELEPDQAVWLTALFRPYLERMGYLAEGAIPSP